MNKTLNKLEIDIAITNNTWILRTTIKIIEKVEIKLGMMFKDGEIQRMWTWAIGYENYTILEDENFGFTSSC